MTLEELTKFKGKAGDIVTMEVEKGAIKKYADAVGDRNPLYWDEEYARNSRYGSIIAPPGFFGWPTTWAQAVIPVSKLMEEVGDAAAQAGCGRVLNGGIEFEFFCPIHAGDTLAAAQRIADISVREGKTGKLVIVVYETTYTNQKGDLVAKASQTAIHR